LGEENGFGENLGKSPLNLSKRPNAISGPIRPPQSPEEFAGVHPSALNPTKNNKILNKGLSTLIMIIVKERQLQQFNQENMNHKTNWIPFPQ